MDERLKSIVTIILLGLTTNFFTTDSFAADASTNQVSIPDTATNADAIPQQYIVTLNTTNEIEILTLQNTIIEKGGEVLNRYDSINAFTAIITEDAMFALRTSTIIKDIESDTVVRGLRSVSVLGVPNLHFHIGVAVNDHLVFTDIPAISNTRARKVIIEHARRADSTQSSSRRAPSSSCSCSDSSKYSRLTHPKFPA